ncbi:M48 family metallopeptidase [uncultured Methylophaga sp.]|uniref:M48 family metallopeptidase n=1 Tax=uncultured Methylophaga sp. TaxID=285271 RepID=UPI0030DB7ADD
MARLKKSILILSFFVLSACSSLDKGLMNVTNGVSSYDSVTGERQLSLISEEEEIRKATERTAALLADAKEKDQKIDSDTPHYERVKRIFDRLLMVAHRQHLPWEIHVVEDERFNAFTIGGGKVFINTGLIDSSLGVRTDDELAAVIAHEIAHVTARHASETRTKLAVAQLADSDLKNQVFEASFTTNQEKEADKYAVIYLALAGFDPQSASEIWKRHDQKLGSNVGNLAYTHPIYDERAEEVAMHANTATNYYIPNQINPNQEELKLCNEIYCYEQAPEYKAGEGGGIVAFFDTLGNAFAESMDAKKEQNKRLLRKQEQQSLARRTVRVDNLQLKSLSNGQKQLVGKLVNTTTKNISSVKFTLMYWSQKKVILQMPIEKELMPREEFNFSIPLKSINFSNVSLTHEHVNFAEN